MADRDFRLVDDPDIHVSHQGHDPLAAMLPSQPPVVEFGPVTKSGCSGPVDAVAANLGMSQLPLSVALNGGLAERGRARIGRQPRARWGRSSLRQTFLLLSDDEQLGPRVRRWPTARYSARTAVVRIE
jgi:hypothetical protein